jgi:cytidylate kinase
MKIFGLGGTNGSGKDTVAQMLAERHGFLNASATEMFLVELKKRGWPIDREHKSKLSAEWRREFGMGVIVDKALEIFKANPSKYKGIIVGSLRHPGETDRIHELGGKQIWVDADPKIRYERIQKSLNERATTHDEQGKTFEEFLTEEKREMTPIGDAATLNTLAVKSRADIFITNDGDDIDSFKDKAEKALGL